MFESAVHSNQLLERLMERSEERIAAAARYGEGSEQQAAARVIESVPLYRGWESRHLQLMRTVACERKAERRSAAFRGVALSTIHLKAPFEYLRNQRVVGGRRHAVISALYGPCDYARTLVREHATFVVSTCSLLCVDCFCGQDELELIAEYEEHYRDYFCAFAESALPGSEAQERRQQETLLGYLRSELRLLRARVLAGPAARGAMLSRRELREPTGSTVRMPALELVQVRRLARQAARVPPRRLTASRPTSEGP